MFQETQTHITHCVIVSLYISILSRNNNNQVLNQQLQVQSSHAPHQTLAPSPHLSQIVSTHSPCLGSDQARENIASHAADTTVNCKIVNISSVLGIFTIKLWLFTCLQSEYFALLLHIKIRSHSHHMPAKQIL